MALVLLPPHMFAYGKVGTVDNEGMESVYKIRFVLGSGRRHTQLTNSAPNEVSNHDVGIRPMTAVRSFKGQTVLRRC